MTEAGESKRPLRNLKVLDLSTFIAGPYAGALLADFGAEVIKVDHPSARAQAAEYRETAKIPLRPKLLNRGKVCITLDLHNKAAKEILLSIVRDTDILIENFRPGVMEKWGLGWEELSRENPGLVMVRVTGYGQDGPYAQKPSFGAIAEAMAGFANIVGQPDGPPTLPSFALADSAAALFGAFAAMMAVYERDRGPTGEGQYIDVSLIESLFAILGEIAINYDQKGLIQKREGNKSRFFGAPRNLYQTKDGKWVAVSAGSGIHKRVFLAIGREDLANDPGLDTPEGRLDRIDEIDLEIESWIRERTAEAVLAAFDKYDAPAGPVYTIDEIFSDPHYQARGAIVSLPDPDLGRVRFQNVVPKLSRTPGAIAWPGRLPGDDNTWFFHERLGLAKDEIERLERSGAI